MSTEQPVDQSSAELDAFTTKMLESEFPSVLAQEIVERGPTAGLESMTPKEAVKEYFKIRDFKDSTKRTQKSALENFFVPWCNEVADINDMSTLGGSDLKDYRVWRREEASDRVDSLKPKTDETQQKIIRTFIECCESFDAVRPHLHEKVLIPNLDDKDEVREWSLDSETAKEILEYQQEYAYATVEHVVLLLLAACGIRISALHSLDTGDVDTNEHGPYLEFRHCPDQGTNLKNDEKSERMVFIPDRVYDVIEDYKENRRHNTTDEYGRKPLLSSPEGRRLCKSTLRNYVYKWTEPCAIGKKCPYGEEPEDCLYARQKNHASKCPDSLPCHPVRKGYITQELKSGVPLPVLAQRCDMSEYILKKHYDMRTDKEKMAAQKTALELAHQSAPAYGE